MPGRFGLVAFMPINRFRFDGTHADAGAAAGAFCFIDQRPLRDLVFDESHDGAAFTRGRRRSAVDI